MSQIKTISLEGSLQGTLSHYSKWRHFNNEGPFCFNFCFEENLLWKEISCWNNGRDQKPKLFRKRIFPECCENFRTKLRERSFHLKMNRELFRLMGLCCRSTFPGPMILIRSVTLHVCLYGKNNTTPQHYRDRVGYLQHDSGHNLAPVPVVPVSNAFTCPIMD